MRKMLLRWAAIGLGFSILLGGCNPFAEPTPLAVGPNGETATPTQNATQQAIVAMLTETSAASTATNTPIVTPTSTPTPTATIPPEGSSERPVTIGARIVGEGAGLIVLSAKTVNEAGKRKATEGSAFLDIEAIVENAAGDANTGLDYAPLYFSLRDAQGNVYQPVTDGIWPALQSGTLRPGEWARGHITFEIPASAGGLRLLFSPQVADNRLVNLWVDLSQPAAQATLPGSAPIAGMATLPGAGQRDEAGGIALSVAQVAVSQRIGYTKAGASRMLVSLMATIENVSRVKSPYNPEYFAVKDEQGYEYPAIVIPGEAVLQPGSLGQGQKVSGQVVFEVPERAGRLVVEYQPQVLVDEYPVIRFQIDVTK